MNQPKKFLTHTGFCSNLVRNSFLTLSDGLKNEISKDIRKERKERLL